MLAIGVLGALLTPPAGVVLFGPGSNEVKLITAKLAARAGYSASYIFSMWRSVAADAAALDSLWAQLLEQQGQITSSTKTANKMASLALNISHGEVDRRWRQLKKMTAGFALSATAGLGLGILLSKRRSS